jgi:SOS-response transcriptional repressor LexA
VEVRNLEPIDRIAVSKKFLRNPKDYFCFQADGNSMIPEVEHGDYVILVKAFSFENLEGKIIAVNSPDGITLKRYIVNHDEKRAYLAPINKAFGLIGLTDRHTVIGRLYLIIRHIYPD